MVSDLNLYGKNRAAIPKASGFETALWSSECAESDCPCEMDCIRLSLLGEGEAYRRLVCRHQSRIATRMWRFTRNAGDHRDLVQDVFVQAFLSLRTYRGEAPFEHWLARIATTVGYRYWKQKSKAREQASIAPEELQQLAAQEPEEMDAGRAGELLHSLLEQLPPRDRLVLALRYVEDRTVEETARLTGWSETMVKVQAWRARNKLRKLFQKAEKEVGS